MNSAVGKILTSRERKPTFDEVNATARAAFPSLLSRWFPKGRLQGVILIDGGRS